MNVQRRVKKFFLGNEKNESSRNKWIVHELKLLPKGSKILDAGAGECKWKDACRHLKYVSQDFCQYDGAGDVKGLQAGSWNTDQIDIVSDITDIPVVDGEFDAVLCSEVLEHLPNPDLAIKELGRVTRRGGMLLLTAPFNSLTHFAPYHYCSGFNIYWYKKHLSEGGWKIIEVQSNGDYFSYFNQELGRLPFVVKKYTKKNTFWITIQALLLGRTLKKVMKVKNDSSELQCFGYFIKAKRK